MCKRKEKTSIRLTIIPKLKLVKKSFLFTVFVFLFLQILPAQPLPGSYYDFIEQTENMEVKPNPATLIIYRPENKGQMNEIRCFLRIQDEEGKDVTYNKDFCTATYEWVNWRSDLTYITKKDARNFFSVFQKQYQGKVQNYKKSYYLSGGMATHLNLKKGKYKITVYTPVENQNMFTYSTETKPFEWKSNTFEYNTENPTNVIFVSPTFTENGFYAGGWKIDYFAPEHW